MSSDTIRTMKSKFHSKFIWTVPFVIAALGLLFAFLGLSDFYHVKIAGRGSAYPFGPTNENPWYYQNASIYANYNLTSGLIFLIGSLFLVWATIKKNRSFVLWSIGLITLFIIVELVNSNAQ